MPKLTKRQKVAIALKKGVAIRAICVNYQTNKTFVEIVAKEIAKGMYANLA